MALGRTILDAAVAAADLSVLLDSISGVEVGDLLIIDQEVMKVRGPLPSAATSPVLVLRGQDGTKVAAHVISAGVVHGTPSEFAQAVAGAASIVTRPTVRNREVRSYSAAGAVSLPTPGNDMLAVLNGTDALAMTLANPAKDNEGDILTIVGNGKAAHTVTYTAGLGNGGSGLDVLTFDTNAQCSVSFVAANEIWVPYPSPLSGTLTGCDVAVA